MTTPRPTYRVERVAPADGRDDLLRLWSDNLHVEGGVEAKFDWLYRDAPLVPDDVFFLRTGDGAVVGTAGVGLRRFQLGAGSGSSGGGDPARDAIAGLLADLAVDKAHRSVGPALALVREVKAFALGRHELAYGFPNALAEGVFKRVGYHPLGNITRWARVLRHADYAGRVRELELSRVPPAARELLYRAAEQPWFATLAGAAVDLAQLARRSPAALEAARRLRVEARPALDGGGIDALWARARVEYGVVAHRTASVLSWRFPTAATRTWYGGHARGPGGLRAYAVVERSDDGSAHIRDLFGHRPDVLALLELLPALLYRTGATSLSMRYLGAPWLSEALAARGFSTRQARRLIVVGTSETLPPETAALVRTPDAWHLTDFDEDA